jgi:uncharacterized protein YbjT (DUF2867 family)
METKTMKRFLVVGASRGVGAAVVERLLAEGHEVTALSRSPLAKRPRLNPLAGDATSSSDVTLAVAGQDAVIVTLGITESPVRVRLLGPRATRIDVRSVGTQHVVDAMRARGVRRLVVLTSYGVGATRDRLGVGDRLLFALLLRPQIEDTAAQERIVTASGLDWTLAQPVHLTDADDDALPFASRDGDTHHMDVSRRSVARFLAEAATSPSHLPPLPPNRRCAG